jgi:hypothetical protein
MRDMTSQDQLDDHASALVDGAEAFRRAAEQHGSHLAAPAALGSLEEALQVLSAAWYRLAADAAPGEGLSREQEVRLTGALHDVAAAFARCARACRQGGSTVTPIVSRRIDHGRTGPQRPPDGDLSWFSRRVAGSERVA